MAQMDPKLEEIKKRLLSNINGYYANKNTIGVDIHISSKMFDEMNAIGVDIHISSKMFDEMNAIGFRNLFIIKINENGIERAIRRQKDKELPEYKISFPSIDKTHDWTVTFIKNPKYESSEIWVDPIFDWSI